MLKAPDLAERAGWVVRDEAPEPTLEVPVGVKTAYLTHGLFRYAGKLPPPLVAYLLHSYSEPGDVVVDPMCGGGTTSIEAVSGAREAINFDINPVSRIITAAVSRAGGTSDFHSFVDRVLQEGTASAPPAELARYYSPETFGVLSRGLHLAANDVERALVLSVARPASHANTKKINTVVDGTKVPRPVNELLRAAADRFTVGLTDLDETGPAQSTVREAIASSLPLDAGAADFVLLHPPYLTNTAFSESMHLQLLLLDTDPKTVRRLELAFRGSYFHVPNGLQKYILGWEKILREARRITRDGGHIAVVIGDGRIRHVRIPIGTLTQEFAADQEMELVERASHILNNQTGWTLSRRMTSQHVLVFRV